MKTHVKICGITNADDALFSAQAGADFLGYVFYKPSKRYVAPVVVSEIVREVRSKFPNVRHVGVFVDEEADNVVEIRNVADLDFAQLHGRETPEYCRDLTSRNVDVIKVLGISSAGAHIDGASYHAPYYLCDTYDENLKGGTGRQFDLSLLPSGLPIARTFIAGGLTPDNVQALLSEIQPYAVDVSTGVEISPGIKSHPLVKSFIDNVGAAMGSPTPNER